MYERSHSQNSIRICVCELNKLIAFIDWKNASISQETAANILHNISALFYVGSTMILTSD